MSIFQLKREQATKLMTIRDRDPNVKKMFWNSTDPKELLADFHRYMETQVNDPNKEWSRTKFRPVTTAVARIAKIEAKAPSEMTEWIRQTGELENAINSNSDPSTDDNFSFPVRKQARRVFLEKDARRVFLGS